MSSMAVRIKSTLLVTQVIGADAWKGGPLVQLDDAMTRPGAEDSVLNACWVRPFVERFRDRVPSQFFVAGTFLFLDKLHLGRLLQPNKAGESKQSVAAEEAKKIKLLIGALRRLWRSSHSRKVRWNFMDCFLCWLFMVVPIIVGLFNSHFFAMLAVALRQDWWTSSHQWLEVALTAITKPFQGWGKAMPSLTVLSWNAMQWPAVEWVLSHCDPYFRHDWVRRCYATVSISASGTDTCPSILIFLLVWN